MMWNDTDDLDTVSSFGGLALFDGAGLVMMVSLVEVVWDMLR